MEHKGSGLGASPRRTGGIVVFAEVDVPRHFLAEPDTRVLAAAAPVRRSSSQGDLLVVAPASSGLHAQLHRRRDPVAGEVQEVVEGHFGVKDLDFNGSPELGVLTLGDGLVVPRYAGEYPAQLAVRHRFNHLEVLGDEPGVPLTVLADGPDHPYLVGTATDCLLDVGIGDEHGI